MSRQRIWSSHLYTGDGKTNCSGIDKQKKKNSIVWVRERTHRPSDRRLSAKWLPTFADKECHVVMVTSPRPYSRFSRQEPLLLYQVAPQLYSRGWVDPVPDTPFFFGSAGNRTRASGSVAKNSDHQTTEAVSINNSIPLIVYVPNSSSKTFYLLLSFPNIFILSHLRCDFVLNLVIRL
jgi:hypothetical protein